MPRVDGTGGSKSRRGRRGARARASRRGGPDTAPPTRTSRWDCASAETRRAPSSTSSPPTRSRTALAGGTFRILDGTWWGHLLCDTGRTAVARRLADAGLSASSDEGWNETVARWERVLARCDLADGRVGDAEPRLRRAEATFRDGDMVLELAETLVVLAEQRRRAGSLDEAGRACSEAIDIAGPRELVPTHASALAARARIRADRGTARRPAARPRRRRSCAAARDEGLPAPVAGARRARQPRAHRPHRGHRRAAGQSAPRRCAPR